MGQCVIDRQQIVAPHRCTLILDVDSERLGVAVVDPVVDPSVTWREISLPVTAPSPGSVSGDRGQSLVKALEEVVYDNPVLLSGFDSVHVILHSGCFMLLPNELVLTSPADDTQLIAETGLAVDDGRLMSVIEIPSTCVTSPVMIVKAETVLVDFLRRTFSNPTFHHPLSAIADSFILTQGTDLARKMLARFHKGVADLLAFGSDGLRYANSFPCRNAVDALYFIIAVRNSLDIGSNDEFLFAGDMEEMRDEIIPLLRRYLAYVMPLPLQPEHSGRVPMPLHVGSLIDTLSVKQIAPNSSDQDISTQCE